MSKHEWLETAARRAAEQEWTLGYVLNEYKSLEQVDEDELLTRLGCDQERRRLLSLCRRPRQDEFEEDVRQIAERLSLDPGRLAQILRAVDVLGALRCVTGHSDVTLLAARDREPETEE